MPELDSREYTTIFISSPPTSFQLVVFPVKISSNCSRVNWLIEFSEFGMDGMRCDVKGNLYIARFGKGAVVKVSPEGKVLQEIVLKGKRPTNVAFGGKDGRTVYVTLQDQGNLESFVADLPGREWKMGVK